MADERKSCPICSARPYARCTDHRGREMHGIIHEARK